MTDQLSIDLYQRKNKPPSKFEVDENFQTPKNICKYMVSLLPKEAVTVLEPTPGLGNILRELELNKNLILTSPEDYFLLDKRSRFDAIVMNPPFSSKSAFLENAPDGVELRGMKLGYYILKECMQMSDSVIALMPWYTISDSDVRMKFLKSFGIKSLTSLPRKTFQYARIQTVIIELSKGYKGETIFRAL